VPVAVVALTLIVSTEEPDDVTLVGFRVAVIPDGAFAVSVTVPLKPPWPVMLIVLVPEPPCCTDMLLGLEEMVKSCTFTVTVAVRCSTNWVPVTVTVYVPPVPEHESVLVCEGVMTVGFRVHARPVLGETAADSATLDENPFIGLMDIVDVPATLGVVLIVLGLAKIWKSTTSTVMVGVVCESGPLVPVTVTV
jgi:hypothetical protein